jgi:hypothetical protein
LQQKEQQHTHTHTYTLMMMMTMPPMLQCVAHNTGAMVLGLLAGCAVNMALISLNSYVLFPPGSELNLTQPDDLKLYIAKLPSAAFGTVFCAHWSQTVVGAYVFCLYATKAVPPMVATQTMAVLTMMGSIMNIRVLPAPAWTWLELPIHPILAYLVATTFTSDVGSNMPSGSSAAKAT